MIRQTFVTVALSVVVTLAAAVALNRPAAVAQQRNANGEQLWDYATLRIEGNDDLIWHVTGQPFKRDKAATILRAIGGQWPASNPPRNADAVFAAGRQGWELVGAQDLEHGEVFWFKRPAR